MTTSTTVANGCVYLSLEEVVERYAGVYSRWTIYDMARCGAQIPHRKFSGRRQLLFPLDELQAFEDGAALELVVLPEGGRVVRPIPTSENGSHP